MNRATGAIGSAAFAGGAGAGNFVELVHNVIEFGMVQAIAEGVELLEGWDGELDMPGLFGPAYKSPAVPARLRPPAISQTRAREDEVVTPEELLDDHTPAVRALAQQLRQLVQSMIPEASERVYPSWHGLGYHHPDAGYFCAIFPLADSVRLLFEHGALLDDRDGLFTGGGSQTRYVELTPGSTIDQPGLERLLVTAIHRL